VHDLLPGTYLLEDFRIVSAPFQDGRFARGWRELAEYALGWLQAKHL
jgi:hypothetical protein